MTNKPPNQAWPANFEPQLVDRTQPVAVLLSGGVDSSVALLRLHQAGFTKIHPFYLKIWLQDDEMFLGDCPWQEDLHYARAVSASLGLTLKIESLQHEYYQRVVHYTVSELLAGRTPSPDLLCNSQIKFGVFLERIHGFRFIASGHYANLVRRSGQVELHRSPDPVKDQSYFLARLDRPQLSRLLFPLAGLNKKQVRALARTHRLVNAERADSQGICFLGKLHYPDFVRHHLGERPGPIVEQASGKILGQHRGYWFHTIGQRQGLGLSNGPWYVCAKQVEDNIVYVRHGSQVQTSAERKSFTAAQVHSLTDDKVRGGYLVKLRHGPQLLNCHTHPVTPSLDAPSGGSLPADKELLGVLLEQPDRGIAPGQFAVFYRGTRCCASAVIDQLPTPRLPHPWNDAGETAPRDPLRLES